MEIKTPIIPQKQGFTKVGGVHELDLQAICVFAAIGFFLDDDTYWTNEKVLSPASTHTFDTSGQLVRSEPWFQWHYTPRDISFEQALDEFTALFETIVAEQVQDKKVILPLSGGLDSRTQAVALKRLEADVFSYSYAFEHGYLETKIAQQIAKACDFDFKAYTIPIGYLWDTIDTLVKTNQFYSDFTSPRQMAIYHEFEAMGDVFSLGHWGDVLFDSMDLPQLSEAEAVDVLIHKLLKRGGLELASKLWETWELDGTFEHYFRERITSLLHTIQITNTNAKLRAFKSLYWAPRWTSVNLSVFSAKKPITLPYYDDRMCEFICTVPEQFLKHRQLQIAYIKRNAPDLARITWQDQRPFNLYNYRLNTFPYNTLYKVYDKLKRELKAVLGKPYVQRNWELQFLGVDNQSQVRHELLGKGLDQWIPKLLIEDCFHLFYEADRLHYAHTINMLLVLSKFKQLNASATFRQAQCDKLNVTTQRDSTT
jgi:hypothetical protein